MKLDTKTVVLGTIGLGIAYTAYLNISKLARANDKNHPAPSKISTKEYSIFGITVATVDEEVYEKYKITTK